MADGIFNIARGRIAEKIADSPSNIEVILLQTAEEDDTLPDRTDVESMLAAGNTEATFTNYTRKTGITGTVIVDNVNNRVDCDIPNQSWASAGGLPDNVGATNNTLAKMIICYRELAGDANLIPLVHFDYITTTDGTTLAPEFDAAGFFRA